MKLKPLFDRVVLKNIEPQHEKNGILVPEVAQSKPQIGIVEEVGMGGILDGNEIKLYVKKGDKVIYSKYAGSEFKFDGITYTLVKQIDILAIMEN